jgi:hypothetical protein
VLHRPDGLGSAERKLAVFRDAIRSAESRSLYGEKFGQVSVAVQMFAVDLTGGEVSKLLQSVKLTVVLVRDWQRLECCTKAEHWMQLEMCRLVERWR